ncbi:hypothetical protein [Novipirellula artificiosorum]|uniref:Secreted protein n=1 Tax=Novipirellula artificiosorum TaxID=2528016 RepID=A0A5C6CZK9_9BACT|nr:hypothetical protein [Novipirellula artificiosorum]TWU28994.1 hypothetical protein Poly41_67850 [Novipirellula artificiosorum]
MIAILSYLTSQLVLAAQTCRLTRFLNPVRFTAIASASVFRGLVKPLVVFGFPLADNGQESQWIDKRKRSLEIVQYSDLLPQSRTIWTIRHYHHEQGLSYAKATSC